MQFNSYSTITILNIHYTHYYTITILIEIHKCDIIIFLKTIGTVYKISTKVRNNIYGTR